MSLVQLCQLEGPQLQHRFIMELDDIFKEIEDGTVKDNTFTGCIALVYGSLPPLNENQSKQIKEVLLCKPVAAIQSKKGGVPILRSVFNLIRNLWTSHDINAHPVQDGAKSNSLLLDQYGRVKGKVASPAAVYQNSQGGSQEIQEAGVKQFLTSHGEGYSWVLPNAWDIANQLNAVKKSDTDGDLALFLERRRKLNVRRPKTTLFEQSVQRYAVKISVLYCDEKGEIINKKSLEMFINELIATLLDKTKVYWPTSPLLAIFDGLEVPVIRPLLYKHQTAYIQSEITTADRVVVSGNTKGKMKELVTSPRWNKTSQKMVVHYVEKAFKSNVWSFFMDRYAPYNREYSMSSHLNSTSLSDVGLLVKSFGNPVHLSKLMSLLRPTNQADELVHYIVDHFRDSDFIDH